jgi:hypothetical protein
LSTANYRKKPPTYESLRALRTLTIAMDPKLASKVVSAVALSVIPAAALWYMNKDDIQTQNTVPPAPSQKRL